MRNKHRPPRDVKICINPLCGKSLYGLRNMWCPSKVSFGKSGIIPRRHCSVRCYTEHLEIIRQEAKLRVNIFLMKKGLNKNAHSIDHK